MSKISWDDLEQRRFSAGVDRGVFYTHEQGYSGVPWYGLTSVKTSEEGLDAKPVYIDGEIQTYDVNPGQFKAVIEALTYPDEFAWFANGETPVEDGFTATNQDRGLFDLSYRTLEGNSLTSNTTEYQIHLVYNAIAIPSDEEYSTLGTDTEPAAFTWDLYTVPLTTTTGVRNTSHFVVHTRYAHPYLIGLIEDILYGTEAGVDAKMPTVTEVAEILATVPPEQLRNVFVNPRFENNDSVAFSVYNGSVQIANNRITLTPSAINTHCYAESPDLISILPADSWVSGAITIGFDTYHTSVLQTYPMRSFALRYRVGATWFILQSTVARSSAGQYRLYLSPKHIPVDVAEIRLYLYNGLQHTTPFVPVYFTDLVLITDNVEADLRSKYELLLSLPNKHFDGYTDNGKWGYGEWTDVVDNSESIYRSFGV